MKKKLKILSALYICCALALIPFCCIVSLVMLIAFALLGFMSGCLLLANKLYLKTNHWKNQFLFEKNFISNAGYRDNLGRNFEVVNLGSNPALFGFFYENNRGQNWATGSQGFPMDFEILKYYHSYVKEGGYVLVPIMPFSSISNFLETRPDYWSDSYYMKFAKILDGAQARKLPNYRKFQLKMRFPVVFNPKLMYFIFHDVSPDNRLQIADQTMQAVELEYDAKRWIKGWMKEFAVKKYEDFWGVKFTPYFESGAKMLSEMIEYCLYRNLKPVIITIPMSSYLAKEFTPEFRQKMITDFVNKANVKGVKVLDYMFDDRFSKPELFNGSFFLNLRGRKEFTRQVMKDLGM
ncbi:MAG: hypothetical protein UHO11_04405 [Treponema sp.]|nr:hypothetical protein [Treponema sp.]